MEYFIRKLVGYGLCAIVFAGVAIALFYLGFPVMASISILLFLGAAFLIVCEIRDYRFYKKMSADMAGKSLEERLKILGHYEECWLSYASAEEVKFFRNAVSQGSDNEALKYLLERASFYNK